jgi:hypothetical protein
MICGVLVSRRELVTRYADQLHVTVKTTWDSIGLEKAKIISGVVVVDLKKPK